MSAADVELIRGLQPPPEADVAAMFEDDATWVAFAAAVAASFTEDFACTGVGGPQGDVHGTGIEGLRDVFREWLSPWASYRSTVEDVVASGSKVMVLVHDQGVSHRDAVEIDVRAASVWTLRDGQIARAEFHANRETARRAFES